ncbi:MAG: type II toxin-antitoxin system RelE/ParE family toxin, partial [Bacteroidales bacterium]|nr:type II toxin-antitoxin system RelE/ParE family toxin [Bacteroidales bacterium]
MKFKKEIKLIISTFAEEDLKEAKEYYNSKKEDLGDEFVEEVEKTLKRILLNLQQYPKVKKEIRKALTDKFPFIIFFVFKSFIVNVLAVFHTSRKPN